MKIHFKTIFLVFFMAICSAIAETPPPEDLYFGLTPPGLTPEVFAPGIISLPDQLEIDICFSKDGGECYFSIRNSSWSIRRIYETHYESGGWTTPALASFSDDLSMVVSLADDDQNVYFNRDGKTWRATRTPGGWSSPIDMGTPINSSQGDWSCHISDRGNAWICSWRPGGMGQCDLWKVQYEDGNFTTASPLNTVNLTGNDCQPVPGPDEEYIIFNGNRPGGYGTMDLYMCLLDGHGNWTLPQNLGPTFNTSMQDVSAYISPDHKYLFFSRQISSTDSDIYWVDIRALFAPYDFSHDGRADFEDLKILAAHWLTGEPLVDIAPEATPDGIANSLDLAILAEHWGYVPPDLLPPFVPMGLAATAGDAAISLDWDDNNESDFDGYNVYRSQTGSTGYTRLNGSLLVDSNYVDNNIIPNTVYFYAVTAVDTSANESAYSNAAWAIVLDDGSIILQEGESGFCGTNGSVSTLYAGFTGTGFVYAPYVLGKYINWSINVPSTGTYTLSWRYALLGSSRPVRLLVNDVEVFASVAFPATGSWTTWSEGVSVETSLTAGANNIRIEATTSSGLANIDYIMITGDNPQPASCP